jgi:hypothetical protein
MKCHDLKDNLNLKVLESIISFFPRSSILVTYETAKFRNQAEAEELEL